jgi:hypothetical protein
MQKLLQLKALISYGDLLYCAVSGRKVIGHNDPD